LSSGKACTGQPRNRKFKSHLELPGTLFLTRCVRLQCLLCKTKQPVNSYIFIQFNTRVDWRVFRACNYSFRLHNRLLVPRQLSSLDQVCRSLGSCPAWTRSVGPLPAVQSGPGLVTHLMQRDAKIASSWVLELVSALFFSTCMPIKKNIRRANWRHTLDVPEVR